MRIERLDKVIPLSMISIFAVLILLSIFDPFPFNIAVEDIANARVIYVYSGVEALAAVLAIVIALTLMAIEFAAQEYTHRIMDTYIKSTMFWSMIAMYLITMIYNIYMVAILDMPVNTKFLDASILSQTLCFLMLVPYFIITTIHLRPESIISRILRTIDKEYISSIRRFFHQGRMDIPSSADRMLPAIEIIERSIEKGDRATTRAALDEIHSCYNKYVTLENEEWAGQYFLNHLATTGRKAITEADDDSMVKVLRILGEIGGRNSSELAIEYIHILGFSALKKDYDVAVQQMIDSFQMSLSSPIKEEASNKIFESYKELSDELFSWVNKRMIRYMVGCVSALTEMAMNRRDYSMIDRCTELLEKMGRSAVAHNIRDVTHQCIQAFHLIGTSSAKMGLDITDHIIEPLLRIEREIDPADREIIGEMEYAKRDIERSAQRYIVSEEEKGIETSDLW